MNAETSEAGALDRLAGRLDEMQDALVELELDGWLLYDLHARNPVAGALLGRGDLTRRFFVFVPASGEPHAIVHGIELAPWKDWPWQRTSYVGWRELNEVLRDVVDGRRLAMEYSPEDAVPSLDRVPAGVLELVRGAGAEIRPSGELITRFYSRWSDEGLTSHRRTASVLADVARAAFERAAAGVRSGEPIREGELRGWVLDRLAESGCGVGADCIVANTRNAADPHYSTPASGGAPLGPDELILLDLWGKEGEDAVFADQTWMAYLGAETPGRFADLFGVIREARDAAVDFVRERLAANEPVTGGAVDDVARRVVEDAGHGAAFIHRTGHSIDQSLHGMGPNIDNLETRETRRLIPGVGFSVEPGIYLADDVGMRTEIDVYIGADGPEVTTPDPQMRIPALLSG